MVLGLKNNIFEETGITPATLATHKLLCNGLKVLSGNVIIPPPRKKNTEAPILVTAIGVQQATLSALARKPRTDLDVAWKGVG